MLGHVEEAIGSFEQVVLLTEDNAQTRAGRAFCLGYLGLAYSELGNWTQARRCCKEADELMSDHESTVDGLPVQVARALVLAKDGAKTEASKCVAALQPVLFAGAIFSASVGRSIGSLCRDRSRGRTTRDGFGPL